MVPVPLRDDCMDGRVPLHHLGVEAARRLLQLEDPEVLAQLLQLLLVGLASAIRLLKMKDTGRVAGVRVVTTVPGAMAAQAVAQAFEGAGRMVERVPLAVLKQVVR